MMGDVDYEYERGEIAGMRKALKAVQSERLEDHERYLKNAADIQYCLNAKDDLSDEGYSMAVQECERAITKLIEEAERADTA